MDRYSEFRNIFDTCQDSNHVQKIYSHNPYCQGLWRLLGYPGNIRSEPAGNCNLQHCDIGLSTISRIRSFERPEIVFIIIVFVTFKPWSFSRLVIIRTAAVRIQKTAAFVVGPMGWSLAVLTTSIGRSIARHHTAFQFWTCGYATKLFIRFRKQIVFI